MGGRNRCLAVVADARHVGVAADVHLVRNYYGVARSEGLVLRHASSGANVSCKARKASVSRLPSALRPHIAGLDLEAVEERSEESAAFLSVLMALLKRPANSRATHVGQLRDWQWRSASNERHAGCPTAAGHRALPWEVGSIRRRAVSRQAQLRARGAGALLTGDSSSAPVRTRPLGCVPAARFSPTVRAAQPPPIGIVMTTRSASTGRLRTGSLECTPSSSTTAT
jgi:hypothetical protein